MLDKLKSRWGVKSNFQILIIFFVFSITGSAAVYVRKLVFDLLNITSDTSLWIKIPLYIIIIVPAYQILLIVIGSIFGQFKFFYGFQKKSLSRIAFRSKVCHSKN